MKFPHFLQAEGKDCGPTCLRIIAKFYGKVMNAQELRNLSETTRAGSNLLGLSECKLPQNYYIFELSYFWGSLQTPT